MSKPIISHTREGSAYGKPLFSGVLIDMARALHTRKRTNVGPYIQTPRDARENEAISFYTQHGRNDLVCARHGSVFSLRLYLASSAPRGATGYYGDSEGDTIFLPIVAKLPSGRGYLAGWSLGAGMASAIFTNAIHDTLPEAERSAHSHAEYDAEREREHQEQTHEDEQREKRATYAEALALVLSSAESWANDLPEQAQGVYAVIDRADKEARQRAILEAIETVRFGDRRDE